MNSQIIEGLIESIEYQNLSTRAKEKKIQELIYLWKFSDSYKRSTGCSDKQSLAIKELKDSEITFIDLDLSKKEKSILFKKSCDTIVPLLEEKSKKGLYYFHLHKQCHNFNNVSLQNLQTELSSSINGDIIPYQYISQIITIPQESLEVCTDTIIKECSKEDILFAIDNLSKEKKNTEKWLVLILDNVQSKCDTFYIEDAVLNYGFSCKFQKLFLFDYYKYEVIELVIN